MNIRWFPIILFSTVLLLVGSFWYASQTVVEKYTENESLIIRKTAELARMIALPYHIAWLSFEEPVEELPIPVYGVSLLNIGDTWGASRDAGRSHEGTDIFAERGTPVFSATEGYVIRLNIGTLGGKNVMVTGPGGVRYYYAHMTRIADGIMRGKVVTPDTVLGYVGNTGNADTTPPHLHFGVYPEGWNAVNPYPLLVDRGSI